MVVDKEDLVVVVGIFIFSGEHVVLKYEDGIMKDFMLDVCMIYDDIMGDFNDIVKIEIIKDVNDVFIKVELIFMGKGVG